MIRKFSICFHVVSYFLHCCALFHEMQRGFSQRTLLVACFFFETLASFIRIRQGSSPNFAFKVNLTKLICFLEITSKPIVFFIILGVIEGNSLKPVQYCKLNLATIPEPILMELISDLTQLVNFPALISDFEAPTPHFRLQLFCPAINFPILGNSNHIAF